jgi:hypothetical protein
MSNFIKENLEMFVLFVSFLSVVFPFWQYMNAKRKEQRWKNFENFHEKIVRKISNRNGETGLDEQIAVIYDLRNFPEYYPVTDRILSDLIKWWRPQIITTPHFDRLIKEAEQTLDYIRGGIFRRCWSHIKTIVKLFHGLEN